MWVLDHLADIESDLSRFHRVVDLHDLDGPHFFRLVWRLSAYGGVIAMRLEAERQQFAPSTAPAAKAIATAERAPQRGGSKHLAAFLSEHPGLIETRKVA